MKKWYSNLNLFYKVSFISIIATIIIFLGLVFCFFIGWMDIPLGMLLGALIGTLFYFIEGLLTKRENSRKNVNLSIFYMVLRYIVIIGLGLLFGFLYYMKDFKVFNLFSLMLFLNVSIIFMVVSIPISEVIRTSSSSSSISSSGVGLKLRTSSILSVILPKNDFLSFNDINFTSYYICKLHFTYILKVA